VDQLDSEAFQHLAKSVGRRLERENPLDAKVLAKDMDINQDGVVDVAELQLWWKRRAGLVLLHAAGAPAPPPRGDQLRSLALLSAVPCFVFGFLDNSIMLIAGETIEASFGLKFGLSGLACAALGNIIADTTGQLSGGTVDSVLRPYLPNPRLTPQQHGARSAKITAVFGGAVGIIVGCCLGSFPLLFQKGKDHDEKADEAK